MIALSFLTDSAAWPGNSFEGGKCERCGRVARLKNLKIETVINGKAVSHEIRLCRLCMAEFEIIFCDFLEKKIVH